MSTIIIATLADLEADLDARHECYNCGREAHEEDMQFHGGDDGPCEWACGVASYEEWEACNERARVYWARLRAEREARA